MKANSYYFLVIGFVSCRFTIVELNHFCSEGFVSVFSVSVLNSWNVAIILPRRILSHFHEFQKYVKVKGNSRAVG